MAVSVNIIEKGGRTLDRIQYSFFPKEGAMRRFKKAYGSLGKALEAIRKLSDETKLGEFRSNGEGIILVKDDALRKCVSAEKVSHWNDSLCRWIIHIYKDIQNDASD